MRWPLLPMLCLYVFVLNVPCTGRSEEPPQAAPKDAAWNSIFNGRNLKGWYVFVDGKKNDDPNRVVQVHDGVIHMYKDTPDKSPAPHAYIASEREYRNYDFRFEYRWGEKKFGNRVNAKRDAGLIYHFTGQDKIWPRGIECQVQEGDTGDIFVVWARVSSTVAKGTHTYRSAADGGVPVTIGSGNEIASITKSRTLEEPGWNKVEVRVRDDRATHLVNGQINNAWTELRQPDPNSPGRYIPLKQGRLLLQAEGAEVLYRNLEVRELP